MKRFSEALSILILIILSYLPAAAAPKLPHLFSDHMVLQQGVTVPVWGWANPGEVISVRVLAITRETTTDARGHWRIQLPPLRAGGPFTLVVKGEKTIELKDVLIGEVWVASGQSNMAFLLARAENGESDAKAADSPQIRLFSVPKRIALQSQDDTLPSQWQLCSPETAGNFSAVAYYFARKLQRELGVPVGIILSSWSGSSAEEWTDPTLLLGDSAFAPILTRWQSVSPEIKEFAARGGNIDLEFDHFELLRDQSGLNGSLPFSDFDDGTPHTALGGSWNYEWQSAPATRFELSSPGYAGSSYAVHVQGWLDGTQSSSVVASYRRDFVPADLSGYAGIRFWARGQGHFRLQSLQPSITDYDNYATQEINATANWEPTTILFKDLRQAGWGVRLPFTPHALTGLILESAPVDGAARPPSGLYNGMISPLAPYAFKGVIWYQGEGNAGRAFQYRKLLPSLIQGWRTLWGGKEFAFLIVQLPNYGSRPSQPADSMWAEMREAQALTANTVPETGTIVTLDLGQAENVHPHRKLEVGERLALRALGTTYGRQVVYQGPVLQSANFEGSVVKLTFISATGSIRTHDGDSLRGFAIAGADRQFYWADAMIRGNVVLLSSQKVLAPVAARYAWADNPEANLFDAAGLPAAPFRTDSWQGITEGRQ